ncbi:MAG: type VI secretion system tube protein Hcp [Bacteroidota bacterium]
MKNIILILALLFTSIGFSQDHQLKIKGLVTGGQFTNLAMDEVHFEHFRVNPRSAPTIRYEMIKRHDNNSEHLESAVKNGKVFNEVQIWVKQAGGKVLKYRLTNVSLSNYSAHFVKGKPATENFILNFQNRVLMK